MPATDDSREYRSMRFDVRAAKQLQLGEHLAVEGLRLVASASKQTWTHRYKSPASGPMKQTAIGPYPKMRASKAEAVCEMLRAKRAAGIDPKEHQRQQRKPSLGLSATSDVFTVRRLVD